MREKFGVPTDNGLFRTRQGGPQSSVGQQPVQQCVEEIAAQRVSQTKVDYDQPAVGPDARPVPVSEAMPELPPDLQQMRSRPVGHPQLIERVFVCSQAEGAPVLDRIVPLLQNRLRIAAPHLGSRVLNDDGPGTLQIALHLAQQMRLSIAGVAGHDDTPPRRHLFGEKSLDIAFDVQPLEIVFRQRFRDRFPARRGKRAPQGRAVRYDRLRRVAVSPVLIP